MENFLKAFLVSCLLCQLVRAQEAEQPAPEPPQAANGTLQNLLFQMRDIQSMDEVIRDYIRNPDGSATNLTDITYTALSNGVGMHSSTISQVPLAQFCNCTPREIIYSFPEDDDPEIVYLPRCTGIMRCGGCSSTNLLACRPIRNETIQRKVLALRFNAETGFLQKIGYRGFDVEEHQECAPQCEVLEDDCDSDTQVYSALACRCVCKDSRPCPEDRVLDPNSCRCVCKETEKCSAPDVFNEETCRCDAPPPPEPEIPEETDEPECDPGVICPPGWGPSVQSGGCSCVPGRRYIFS